MLPANFAWLALSLAENGDQPKMIAEGVRLYGTHEGNGVRNNPVIMGWVAEIAALPGRTNVAQFTNDHKIPWCGLYMAHAAHFAGYDFPDHPLWAANWAGFGEKSTLPSLGDVLVFNRPGGHHVGNYVAEDETAFHVLGGNEGDQVGIVRELKSRLVACRRPPYQLLPANVRPYRVASTGALSTNEV